jgi:hypothetical protein
MQRKDGYKPEKRFPTSLNIILLVIQNLLEGDN